ncbi:MAG: hypothetical protein DME23_12535 [Verrucomicrobia bacterium]|nr:MAG: hypothetical protein DME23_12535 [Verrucomicrobiota bacterium]
MNGKMDFCWSRTVLVKTSVSPLAVIMFAFVLSSLFHNMPALAGDGCPAPSFAAAPRASDAGGHPDFVADSIVHALGGTAGSQVFDGTIQVLLSKGDGTFQPPVSYGAGGIPAFVTTGDFNGDGKPDLAVANYASYDENSSKYTYGNVAVLLGRGDGTFQAASKYSAGSGPDSAVVGDFNGDGRLDLVVANFGSYDRSSSTFTNSGVSVLLGKGDGSFQTAGNYKTGAEPASLAVGDFNGDSKLDLAVANRGSYPNFTDGNVSVLVGKGDGTFQAAVNYSTGAIPLSIVVGDFTGDGEPDLAVANGGSYTYGFFSGGSVSVLSGKGDGTFKAPVRYDAGTRTYSLVAGDFDGDGRSDLAVVNSEWRGTVSVLLAKSDGTFHAPVKYSVLMEPGFVATGDFNGDGKPDLAVPNWLDGNVSVLLGNGDGTFPAAVNYGVLLPRSIAAGDINGDGKPDLAVAHSAPYPDNTTISVFLGQGDGTFKTAVNSRADGNPVFVAIGDFNGDGKADLTVVSEELSGSVSVLLGRGDGTFRYPVSYPAGAYPVSVAVGDLNGDGKPDLAVASLGSYDQGGVTRTNGGVSVLLNKGDGTFQAAVVYLAGSGAWSVAAKDFNGDNKLDLAVAGIGTNSVSVLLGNGDGTFRAPINFVAGVALYSVATGDFNGDGKADLAVGTSGGVSVLLGKGDGTFQTAVNYGGGAGAVAVDDFNGDGRPDLAVADLGFGSSYVSVLLGNGDGTFQTAIQYSAGSNPSSIALGDFNGDRKPDMAVANLTPDTVSVLVNTCQSAKFNHRPIARSQAFSVNEGAEVEITLYASDADNDAVIYTVADPTHGTLSGTPPNLVYQPALHYIGQDSITFTVNDGKTNSPPATISITVLPTRHTPGGRVVAWGNNYSGQCNVPRGPRDVVAVTGGYSSSMALRSNGTVVAWGKYPDFSPAYVPPGLRGVVALDGGAGHALALRSNGTVIAWGPANQNGQDSVPPGLSNVVTIAAGANHNVASKSDGTVVAWGDSQFSATSPPARLSNVVAVAAGGYHNLALKADGTVVAIAAGWEHSLALKSDGSVMAWGRNVENETRVPPGVSNIVAIAAGDYHSLVLRADGKLLAWGYDAGDGVVPVPAGLTNVAAIACGGEHNLVIVTNSSPVARPQTISVNEDASMPITLSAFDADQDALAYTVGSPAHGTLSGTPPDVVYRPALHYFGPDSFAFKVNDGEADSAPATVSITVLPVNHAPVADASATPTRVISSINRDARVVLDGSRSHDIDNDPLQFSWFVDGAATASATGRVAVVVLSVGTHDVRLLVDDGQASDTNSIALRVLTADDAVDKLIAHMQAAKLRHPHSLLKHLSAAERAIDDGKFDLCAHHLRLFQEKLRELQERNEVDSNVAAALLQEAQATIAALGDTQHSQPAFTVCKCEKGGRVRLEFNGIAARTYLIEASTDFQTWVPVGVGRERIEGDFEFEEPGARLPQCRFYRIVTP